MPSMRRMLFQVLKAAIGMQLSLTTGESYLLANPLDHRKRAWLIPLGLSAKLASNV